jgi:hypothetical protein
MAPRCSIYAVLALLMTISTVHGQEKTFQIPPDETPVQLPATFLHAQLIETTELIRAREARTTFRVSGANLTAVILDTGVRETHSDFAGRIVAVKNFSTADGGDATIVTDRNGHGTHVAGIVAANGIHTGIAPGANIVVLKVLDDRGHGDFGSIDSALQWVLDNADSRNIRVVNISIGDGQNLSDDGTLASDTVRQKIAALRTRKVAVVVAAGNDYFRFSPRTGTATQGMAFPAIVHETVSVGAVYDGAVGGFNYQSGAQVSSTRADQICVFSQRLHQGANAVTRTDIFAPGAVLTSTGIHDDSGESAMQGTSQAAPVISGTILLMQDFYFHQTHDYASIDDIEDSLREGSVNVRDVDEQLDNVKHTTLTFNRVDVVGAITALQRKQHLGIFKAALNIEPVLPPEARQHLDWAIANRGATDCPLEYAAYPECILPDAGGRLCLMRKAMESAKANDCSNAFRLSLVTQCHNPAAEKTIAAAGQEAVCAYLRKK